jgi:hypothetical protein
MDHRLAAQLAYPLIMPEAELVRDFVVKTLRLIAVEKHRNIAACIGPPYILPFICSGSVQALWVPGWNRGGGYTHKTTPRRTI